MDVFLNNTESRFPFPNNLLIGDAGMRGVSIFEKSYAEIPTPKLYAQPCTNNTSTRSQGSRVFTGTVRVEFENINRSGDA